MRLQENVVIRFTADEQIHLNKPHICFEMPIDGISSPAEILNQSYGLIDIPLSFLRNDESTELSNIIEKAIMFTRRERITRKRILTKLYRHTKS